MGTSRRQARLPRQLIFCLPLLLRRGCSIVWCVAHLLTPLNLRTSPPPSTKLTGHSLRSCLVPSSLSPRSFYPHHWNQTMNLISVNINGLNDHTKRTALVDWLKCMKADVACLQETHTPSHESARKWFANSGYRVASSSFTSKSAGVAILVKDTYKISRIIKDEHGRFIQVFIDFGEN